VKTSSPEIRWIGDLDGDSRPDIYLFDDTSETGSKSWELYLSRGAERGSLFRLMAGSYIPG
jgi:hypothetical protein